MNLVDAFIPSGMVINLDHVAQFQFCREVGGHKGIYYECLSESGNSIGIITVDSLITHCQIIPDLTQTILIAFWWNSDDDSIFTERYKVIAWSIAADHAVEPIVMEDISDAQWCLVSEGGSFVFPDNLNCSSMEDAEVEVRRIGRLRAKCKTDLLAREAKKSS